MNHDTLFVQKRGVVLSGATSVIGKGIVKALKNNGIDLQLTYFSPEKMFDARSFCEEYSSYPVEQCDLTDESSIASYASLIKERWDPLHFVVIAGVGSTKEIVKKKVASISPEHFLETALKSALPLQRVVKAFSPLMTAGGSIITLGYRGSDAVIPGYGGMGPIKALQTSLMRYLAVELGPKGIRLNEIRPGAIDSPSASAIRGFKENIRLLETQNPLRRLSTPEDVGNLVAFLVSDFASAITGQVIDVDAGEHLLATVTKGTNSEPVNE